MMATEKKMEHFPEVLLVWHYLHKNSGKSHILFWENDSAGANIDINAIISENKTELLGLIQDSLLKIT